MNISEIRLVKHIKLEYDTYTTHVFTFEQPVDVNSIMKHPAVSVFLDKVSYSNYKLVESSCPKTIRLKIANNSKDCIV